MAKDRMSDSPLPSPESLKPPVVPPGSLSLQDELERLRAENANLQAQLASKKTEALSGQGPVRVWRVKLPQFQPQVKDEKGVYRNQEHLDIEARSQGDAELRFKNYHAGFASSQTFKTDAIEDRPGDVTILRLDPEKKAG